MTRPCTPRLLWTHTHTRTHTWGEGIFTLRKQPDLGLAVERPQHMRLSYRVLPCVTHVSGPSFQGKNFCFNFLNSIIYFYLDTCFVYYKGILAFIFEHIVVPEIVCNQ